jgi:hypothetical protein
MTAPATTRRAGPFNGNGVTTSFPFTFKVFATSDIAVTRTSAGIETVLVLGVDYSVTLNADQDTSPGGTITYPISGAPLAVGEKLVALGNLPYDQTADLPSGGNYRAIVIENALDRTVMQVQQLAEETGRSLTLPASAASANTELPSPVANKVIGWNETGTALVNLDASDLASVVVAGTAYTDIFDGTGTQTGFTLSANPGSVNALDIAISGVSQVNGVDFTVSGTTLTFTSAPPAGTGNVCVRYVAALPVSTAAAENVTFNYSTAYSTGSMGSVIKRTVIDVTQPPFNCDPTGVGDCSTAVNLALTAYPGVPLFFPAGSYRFNSTVSIAPAASWGVFGPGAIIRGAGVGQTFLNTYVAGGPLFDVDSPTHGGGYTANMGTVFSGFNITRGGSTANTTGIRVLNGYQIDIEQTAFKSLAVGVELKNGLYLDDGWNRVRIRQAWFDTCTKWGIQADGPYGRNEGSFTQLENVFFQTCGTAETPCTWTATISGTTMTVSSVASGSLVIGRKIVAPGVDGDTVIDAQTSGSAGGAGDYTIRIEVTAGVPAVTPATVAAPTIMHDAPTSGGMLWKGQVLTVDSTAAANGCQNVALYIRGGSGLANSVDLRGWVSENTLGRGLYCTGVTNLRMRNCQVYNNNAYPGTTQIDFEAAQYTIRQVDIDGAVIRATSGNNPITAFKLSGTNADLGSCRVRNVSWDNFDYTGQTRFSGWQFPPVERQCEMEVAAGFVRYRAAQTAGRGRSSPIRLRTGVGGVPSVSGEWVAFLPPTAGVAKVTGTLSAGTTYYVYLYDAGSGSATLDFSTTVPVLDADSGYMVKTGDASMYYIGAARTDGAGTAFLTSGVGWLNPEVVYSGATGTGTPYYRWTDSTGDLRVKTTAPTSDTDGTVVGTQT